MKQPIQFTFVAFLLFAFSIDSISQIDSFSEIGPKAQKSQLIIPSGDETKDMFDLVFEYPCAIGGGEAGVECDGLYIYTTKWNGNEFYKYNMDGSFVEIFTIDNVSGIRDLAWDGSYFYGGAASTTVYQMDFDNQLLVSTFTAPTDVRAIAYNAYYNSFYANNWGTDIVQFNFTGSNLGSFSCGPFGDSYYGFAFDSGWYAGMLWGYAQVGSSQNVIIQMELPSGEETGIFHDLGNTINVGTGLAGGLCIRTILPYEILIGVCQNVSIWGIELYPWSVAPNNVGVESILQPASGVTLTSEEIVEIRVRNYGIYPQSDFPVSFSLNGSDLYFDTINQVLDVGSYIDFTFDTLLDLSNPTISYTIEACTYLENDDEPNDDCKTKTLSTPTLFNSLEGIVTNASSGSPIEGAMIDFYTYNAITGADGYFMFEEIPDGTYDLSVAGGGYCPWDTTLTFASNQTIFLNIELEESLIEFSDDTLSIAMEPDMTAYLYFDVSNPGTCDVYYSAGSNVSWLGYPTTISGEIPSWETIEIGWFMGSYGLGPGSYEGHIIFQSGAVSSPDSILVLLEVLGNNPPINLTGTIECTDICLEWEAPTSGSPLFYNVYRDGSLVSNFTGFEFCEENLDPGTEYCYMVTAVYDSGESEPTDELCLTVPMPDNLEPTELVCYNGCVGNEIEWEPPEGCLEEYEGFNIYRDGWLLNTTPLQDELYYDIEGTLIDTYEVTTVYYFGESEAAYTECFWDDVAFHRDEQVNIYPNPTHTHVAIRAHEIIQSIEVRNFMGNLIYASRPGKKELSVDLSGQLQGVYLITFELKHEIYTKKLVKL